VSSQFQTFAKIAWRESRASAAKFIFVIVAVALGVASLTGVRGFSRAFQAVLLREARTLMAADLSVRVFALPSPAQTAEMQKLEARGVRRTWLTETLTMASDTKSGTPLLVSVKAVDPHVYPFYGVVKLNPPGAISEKLTQTACAVSEDLLLRLNMKPGDDLRIGGEDFRIVGKLESEPDRMSGSMNVGPRILMSREGLERTGLLMPGSRAAERFLFRIPAQGIGIEEVRRDLKSVFPDSLINDFRQTNPAIEQGLERATIFLSLVSLIALIVGSLGVATAIQAHLAQKMDGIAVMKCLGARSNQIVWIYVLQTAGLGLAGGVLGVIAGLAVQRAFPLFIARYFSVSANVPWDFVTAGQGMLIALLSTLLFTLPPLLSIKRIRPGLIFRREMTEGSASSERAWKRWLRNARESIVSAILILVGIGAIAAWLSDSARMGIYFVAGLAGSLLFLAGVAWALLRGLRALSRRSGRTMRPSIRHGIANLYRPGNHAQSALVALGIGVMFTLTVYLVQRGMLAEMVKSAPPGMPNVFLLDMTPRNRDAVVDLIAHQAGVEKRPETVGTVAATINAIDGNPLVRGNMKGISRRYSRAVSVSPAATQPKYTTLVEGKWWNLASTEPRVSVSEEASKVLNLHPGSRMEWSTPSRQFTAIVAAVHKTENIRLTARIEFFFSPKVLDGMPVIYYASVRVLPAAVPQLQRAVYQRFPTVTVVNVADVMQIVQDVVDQISLVIRFISAFAILAGAIILASSVAGTRFRRIREVVILKTLGATRNRVAEIFSIEFLILGVVAGLMGSLLATGFANVLLHELLNAPMRFDAWPNLICVVLTALVANIAGWLASFRILGQKPLEVLRHE
jgi:putative ABC transport system permease protein